MIEARSAAWRLRRTFQMTAAAATLLAFAPAPAAHAQGLFSFFGGGPSPYDIERRLDASGYALTGPLLRRGDVYLADVVVMGRRGDPERLVIDADTGRIVQRYRVRPARWRDAPGEWDSDDGDISKLRPPADLDRPAPPRDQMVRDENPALGTGAPRTTGVDIEQPDKPKPKPRPHEVKSKAVPLAKTPAPMPQNDASAGPAATAPAVAAPPVAAPSPAAMPSPPAAAKNEAAPPKSDAAPALPQPSPSPSAVTAKVEPPAAPAPKSPPAAGTGDHKATTKSKTVNDIPVTPLD